MKRYLSAILFVNLSLLVFAQTPTFEIKLEEEDLVDLNHWVDQDGFILIDAAFDSHNHYFYLLNPQGEVLATYKNYFKNFYYQGFTSNKKELTVYFSLTQKGELQFIDFFKEERRPAISTTWTKAPKKIYDLRIESEGYMFYLAHDKKKNQLEITSIIGPANEFKVSNIAIEKDIAKLLLSHGYQTAGLASFFEPHSGGRIISFDESKLEAFVIATDKCNKYSLDLSNSRFESRSMDLPPSSGNENYSSILTLANKLAFIAIVSDKKSCLLVADNNLNLIKDRCYDEQSDLSNLGVTIVKGERIDEKGDDSDNSKILKTLNRGDYGFIQVFQYSQGHAIKIGSWSPPSAASSTPLPDGGSLVTMKESFKSYSFSEILAQDFERIGTKNFFDKVIADTGMQFNVTYPGERKFLALSKDFYFKVEWDFKKTELDIYRYAIE